MPYLLRDRALPDGFTDETPAPCIFCGTAVRHFNSDHPEGLGYNVNAVHEGRARVFRYHVYPCAEAHADRTSDDPSIWRCRCVADYTENVGARCAGCGTPRPPPGEYAVPFLRVRRHELGMSLVAFPDGRETRVSDKYARKLARTQGGLDWHRRAEQVVELRVFAKPRTHAIPGRKGRFMSGEELFKPPWGLGRWALLTLGAAPAVQLPVAYAEDLARMFARYVKVKRPSVALEGPPYVATPHAGNPANGRLVMPLGDLRRETADLPDETFVVLEHPTEPRAFGRGYTQPAVAVERGRQTAIDLDFPFVPAGTEAPPGESFPVVCITPQRRRP